MSFLAKGDVAFSVGMTTVSTVIAPVMTPLWMTYLVGQTVEMDGWGMFKFYAARYPVARRYRFCRQYLAT